MIPSIWVHLIERSPYKMTLLKSLIEVEAEIQSESKIIGNIGDGYLLHSNKMFRNVRTLGLANGVSYTSSGNSKFYDLCHHLSFDSILSSKTVPYFKNLEPFIEMTRRIPGLTIDRALEVKKNKVLHETSHILIFDQIHRFTGKLAPLESAYISLISEAFASATETMGQLYINSDVQRWFYRQNTNSFGCEDDRYLTLLNKVTDIYGAKFTFKFIMYSFLCWNLLLRYTSLELVGQIITVIQEDFSLSGRSERLLAEFCGYHFLVRDHFRINVAEFYFRSNGTISDILELKDIEPFAMTKKLDIEEKISPLIASLLD